MTSLVEFLTARLDEDEKVAKRAASRIHKSWGLRPHSGPPAAVWSTAETPALMAVTWPQPGEHIARHDPSRVLADVAAKRAIRDEHWPQNSDLFPEDGPQWCQTCPDRDGWPCPTVRALLQPYADHPDFDPAWRTG